MIKRWPSETQGEYRLRRRDEIVTRIAMAVLIGSAMGLLIHWVAS